ncbi:ThiF family adenylyltransferase [Ramlibacter tataouinensis]|uniref:HesA/MoeB/ThiF family protein n=1 Tax=Ramlibacter tataouinensis TaxID=94132 RepID=UPI0022F3F61F|nr:ThiF family adenylyltransferase [Ramlibacter tataouinensis]WBY00042.1 ThiF family adenylyltransferase [Ramlibacter tataouinensis]
MTKIAFPLDALARMHELAASHADESCAVGFVQPASPSGLFGQRRYVVQALEPVPHEAYQRRTPERVSLTSEFILAVSNRARAAGAGIALLHTHPGANGLDGFSPVDDAGEMPLADYFGGRLREQAHFAGVVTHSNLHLRELGCGPSVIPMGVGPTVHIYGVQPSIAHSDLRYDRQVRAFGQAGQARLRDVRVAIVGAGGTGSFIAHELAHLGIGHLLLIDHDTVDTSNLNRLLGTTPADVGLPKVAVAQRAVLAINPQMQCEVVASDVVDVTVAARLLGADFIFGCTDSMASRAVINQIAYQYLIPAIDMGVAIHVREGRIASVTGRVQMLSPGLGCLVCADGLDGQQVRWELMSAAQRRADPYFENASIPQPAVMPLNGVVTSAAVAMFLSALTGYPGDARLLHYDGVRSAIRPQLLAPRPGCIVCSGEGALARGDAWGLPVRMGPGHG